MKSCAFGPCDASVQSGGPGCYLCDTVAALPQPNYLSAAEKTRERNLRRDGHGKTKGRDPRTTARRRKPLTPRTYLPR